MPGAEPSQTEPSQAEPSQAKPSQAKVLTGVRRLARSASRRSPVC